MSSIVNKIKDAVHSDKSHSQPEGTSGPHNSRVGNTADPRVDSDRDHRANPNNSIGTGHSGSAMGPTSTTGTYGTTGPHSSNMANKADPRVDSDRDHRANPASNMGTGTTGGYGSSTTGTTGMTGTGRTTGTTGTMGTAGTTGTGMMGGSHGTSTNHGPHSSNMANKADPRVDSDRDGRAGLGGTTGATGTYGSSTTGTTGAYGSSTTGMTGTGRTTGATSGLTGHTGPGPAPNTAGPHKSDMMNKADPRVDSDLDGSKTMGQDKTYRSGNATTAMTGRDPLDAAQVPPSVMQKHLGEPVVEHDDHGHDRARRNSRATAQENFRGI
ncbi:hypothetical protein RB595_007349 [Gaeumannomyces hyphopodioides]